MQTEALVCLRLAVIANARSAAGQAAQRPFHFIRTHKPTGTTYTADFNGTHDPRWGGDEWRFTSVKTLERIAAGLIERWNRSRPENDLWAYRLADGPAPAAAA